MAQLGRLSDSIYDKTEHSYDDTRCSDPDIVTTLYELLSPSGEGAYLDVGCGSGNYAIGLSERGLSMAGLDCSEEMLHMARRKSDLVRWFLGDARDLPFSDSVFDGVTFISVVHHISNYDHAFSEASRVLKPGSNIVIFTATPDQQREYWLVRYFPEMMEEVCKNTQSEVQISDALLSAGFDNVMRKKYFVTNEMQDWCFPAGKHRPHIYFDPVVRESMSIFRKKSDHHEIDKGLLALRTDIESGKIKDIIKQHESPLGDCMFFSAIKK